MTDQIEQVARALCELRIRSVRLYDTDPIKLESMMDAAVDHAWPDFIDQAKAAIAAMQQAQEPVAWRYERTDGFVILVSKRYTDQHPKGDGWTEQALGVIPTPPNGGSDAAS